MFMALRVGEVVLQVLGAGCALVIPDIIDEPFPRLEGTVFSRDGIAACE